MDTTPQNTVKGPSKWDLHLGLFENTFSSPRYLEFTLENGDVVKVSIQSIGRESGSGESWNIVADVISIYTKGQTHEPELRARVKIYHETVQRMGTMTLIAER